MKNNKLKTLVIGLIMLSVGAGLLVWALVEISDDNEKDTDTEFTVTDDSTINDISEPANDVIEYTYEVDLVDVTGGSILQGISTGNLANGTARSVFSDGSYMLLVNFSNLPDPIDDSFYEGWLVNPDTGDFLSTGKVSKDDDGKYVNTFTSVIDYTKTHNKYVLTLEPNDGDPAPADHIVDGLMAEVQS